MFVRRLIRSTVALTLIVIVGGAWAWSSGMRAYVVDSGSMSPTIQTGALVVDVPMTAATTLHVGDVITFHPTPAVTTTHRIAVIDKNGITTKGDANPSDDVGHIQPSMVVGKVAFSVPFAGYAVAFFQQPLRALALLLLIVALLGVWQLTDASSAARQDVVTQRPDAP